MYHKSIVLSSTGQISILKAPIVSLFLCNVHILPGNQRLRKNGAHKSRLIAVGGVVMLRSLYLGFKDYCDHSSVHGLRYITDDGRNIVERILWVGVCASAGYAAYLLVMASWYNFQNNAVSFGVDTAYLNWNTTFPAISICENESPDKIYESGTKLFGKERNMNTDFYLRDIAFFDGTCYSCKSHCGVTMNCTNDLQYLVRQVRANCTKMLDYCQWNGQPFNCCSHFLPLETETGICYTLNSLHTPTGSSAIEFISNRKTGPGRLNFQVFESVRMFIHAPDDVPYINHPQDEKTVLNWGSVSSLIFHVNEIDNDPTLKYVPVEQRNCRFPNENILKSYRYYSYSACVVDCRAKAQIKLCNCTHHFMPKLAGVKTCDIKGLACLTKYQETLRALKTEDNVKKGLVCNCMSSCTEPEYTIISKTQSNNDDYSQPKYGTKISVEMGTLPTQRFKRNVVRTQLDLVVSMGGTAGLFLGASILSTVEMVYFLFLRRKAVNKSKDEQDEYKSKPQMPSTNYSTAAHYSNLLDVAQFRNISHGPQLKHREGYAFPYLS